VYEIALTVEACLRSGTRVDVAWVLQSDLAAADGEPVDPGDALALTPGGGRVGRLYGGALDDQVAECARALGGSSGRVVTLAVGDLEARAFGLAGPGTATCVVTPAALLPADLWPRLQDREALAIRLERSGNDVTGASLLDELPAQPETGSALADDEVVTVLRPVPTLVLAGGGPVLDALVQLVRPLGWRSRRAGNPDTASGLVVGLGPLDMVVLAMHDVDLAGPVLAATLSGRAGYVAALGSRAMQESRETWLTDRGIAGHERIHTPAGLDIGADGPAEVAVAILAQAIAVRSERGAKVQAIP
jgi:xanthine dehydrogenase accessory factor